MINLNCRPFFRYFKGVFLIASLLMLSMQASAGVVLGNTRLIYPSDAKEIILSLKNTEKHQNFLVQSTIEGDNDKKQQNFFITPPLFVMKPNSENKIRVFLKTVAPMPLNRETLFWMSIKAVPSSERRKEGNFVQFAVTNKIKLFYRPKALGTPDDKTWRKITFSSRGNEVVVHNPTPFYMNIASINTGSLVIESLTLSPNDTMVVAKKSEIGSVAEVVFINDFGGESKKMIIPVTL